jgi:hypothetical protein
MNGNAMYKLARLMLKQLHAGLLAEHVAAYKCGRTDDHGGLWRMSAFSFNDPANPTQIVDELDPPADIRRFFPLNRGNELYDAGLIVPVYEFSPYIHCLTTKGCDRAIELFGHPSTRLFIQPDDDAV